MADTTFKVGRLIVTGEIVFGDATEQDAAAAPLESPALTGDPTAPTPPVGDNDTSIATTAFVTSALAAAGANPATGAGTYLVSGGGVAYVSGLTYRVSAASYVIAGA